MAFLFWLVIGQHDMTIFASEQLDVETLFKPLGLTDDGRLRQALLLGRSPQTTDVDAQDNELCSVDIGDVDLEWPYHRQKKRGDSKSLVFPDEPALPGCPYLVPYEADVGRVCDTGDQSCAAIQSACGSE